MKKLLLFFQNHQTAIAGIVLFLISITAVVYLSPREIKFKYEFQKGKPWLYENLVAPFDFAVLKSEEAIAEEKEGIINNKTIFLSRDIQAAENALVSYEQSFQEKWREIFSRNRSDEDSLQAFYRESWRKDEAVKEQILYAGRDLLGAVFRQGVLEPFEDEESSYGEILLNEQGVSSVVEISQFYSIKSASEQLHQRTQELEIEGARSFLLPILLSQLTHNIYYDKSLTDKFLADQLDNILPTRNMVQKGELIIFKGNIVDDEKFAKLRSLRETYEGGDQGQSLLSILLGQILQVALLYLILYLFLKQFRLHLLEDISKLSFILINMLFMFVMVRMVMDFGLQYIWLVPLPILPITLRSFFDTRLALFVHMISILLCGFLVPNSFVFIYLQFVAGVFSVFLVSNLYKRSQLFFTAGQIILVYCISYLSVAIIQEGNWRDIHYMNFAFFAGNGFLTLMSFPLIYFQEKIFGLVSDVSLLELSDTNNPLLRELGQKAPGTFQHSLQVANLAEAATLEIGGNALLVRTGALYHDIGKIRNPMYFIENQSTGLNPHDELSFEESSEIIINHVLEGIKMAKKYNLPDVLIDFIRTHHGTTTVMYFYKQYIKNFPEEEVDLNKFTYPGPKPFSKETAVLMMADSVEAASRSLNKPTHDTIDSLVESIINHQMDAGQFENANITMKDIKLTKKIFKKMLANIYHVRVQYPD